MDLPFGVAADHTGWVCARQFVENDKQRERVEQHIALTSMPYEKTTLKDQAFLDAVRAGTSGC